MVRILNLLIHAAAAALSLWLAFTFRFYFDPFPGGYGDLLMRILPWVVLMYGGSAEAFGLTRMLWHHGSIRDANRVLLASGTGFMLFGFMSYVILPSRVPNGVILLHLLFSTALFLGIRYSGRVWKELRGNLAGWQDVEKSRVLILGGGDRGDMAVRMLEYGQGVEVVGFLDPSPELKGKLLFGHPFLGTPDQLAQTLMATPIDEVVVALPALPPEEVKRMYALVSAAGAKLYILPEFTPLSLGDRLQHPIREVQMSDFLGREPVRLDPAPLIDAYRQRVVLVTGAGGSVGSELCRQLADLPLKHLVLLDFSETALFDISEELKGLEHAPELTVCLCDIRFKDQLQSVYDRTSPDVVIHAAAYKHVPLMEEHPLEAARTNVLGTQNLIEAAKKSGVRRLMNVSTDKAVEPMGVMGASKARGEQLVLQAGYSCVRFGNVLGSSGSVIPLFEQQWSRGGKLRVTHREATRYFMTIEEAVLLILHAEALQESGEIYVLDMGEPVRIIDLAEQLMTLRDKSASHQDRESKIEIVGLRPGERIHERLHTADEMLVETRVEKVRRIASGAVSPQQPPSNDDDPLRQLKELLEKRDENGVREFLLGH